MGVAQAVGGVLDRVEVLGCEVGVLEQPGALRPGAHLVAAVRGDHGQPRAKRSRHVSLGAGQAVLEQVAEVFPALGLRVEVGERDVGVRVVRVVLDRALVGRRRGGHVAQVVPLDDPDAVDELLLSRRVAPREHRPVERHALSRAALVAQEIVDARE